MLHTRSRRVRSANRNCAGIEFLSFMRIVVALLILWPLAAAASPESDAL